VLSGSFLSEIWPGTGVGQLRIVENTGSDYQNLGGVSFSRYITEIVLFIREKIHIVTREGGKLINATTCAKVHT